MSDTAWMLERDVRCRCGQMGVISGVEEVGDRPDCIWVDHRVGMAMQTHIHRQRQMPGLLAQLREPSVPEGDGATDH